MARASIRWKRIATLPELQRSSQTIGIAGAQLSVFGGEFKPREPVDNKVYTVPLNGDGKLPDILVLQHQARVLAYLIESYAN